MATVGKLVDLDGWLCVLEAEPLWTEPTLRRTWWPVGIRTTEFVYAWGKECLGRKVIEGKPGDYYGDGHLKFSLKDGGSTKPMKVEQVPIPPPKTKKQTRWYNGRWQKYLASGWKDV